ncbi:geranylgeranyl pyrophosphate synthase [Pelotomaculum thermopropionicum SI]|uniref:Farnesyl diphosphate synthase n=1 Tax=Pelotomaculum thermopropionicum (strain DSM 13744 / JCM 10971 / SI) TaxID=370438 RepID=A5D2Z4_PELTS|nr:geranylgeranyl pyrophosphate synthase [Pelotomaculum thermopropionicum SI]
MMNFKEELKKKAALVEEALERYLPPPDAYPPLIHHAMRYSVLGGGKRLRPALVMAGAEAVGGNAADVLPAACAVELIHTYSLVHDDLPAMDNDDYRRGRLTNHKVYGEAAAILAGDALLTLAFELLANNDRARPENIVRVIREAAAAAGTMGLIGGQVVDTFSAGKEIDESTLEYIHRHKTGALYRFSVRAGAMLAGAQEEQLASLTAYAEHLGLAFQIKDDILDVEGDEKKIGKPVGSDVRNRKSTYPSLFGMEYSRKKARQAVEMAKAALQPFGGEADFLRMLAQFVIDRDF